MSTALSTMAGKLASRLGMDAGTDLMNTLKNTAFKGGNVTDEQFTALLIVANQYGLNPWTKEIYAFPDKGGIVPVVGVDGWARIIKRNILSLMEWSLPTTRKKARVPARYTGKTAHTRPSLLSTWESVKRNTQPWQSHLPVCFVTRR
ncbi:phage recombination protein Bet [Klebsiella pneumoniae]|nr:phage recombination protein Bet [Klebsiella pneumoniae]